MSPRKVTNPLRVYAVWPMFKDLDFAPTSPEYMVLVEGKCLICGNRLAVRPKRTRTFTEVKVWCRTCLVSATKEIPTFAPDEEIARLGREWVEEFIAGLYAEADDV